LRDLAKAAGKLSCLDEVEGSTRSSYIDVGQGRPAPTNLWSLVDVRGCDPKTSS
jgi:hypothetical protein